MSKYCKGCGSPSEIAHFSFCKEAGTLEKSDLSPHAVVSDYKIPDAYSPSRRSNDALGSCYCAPGRCDGEHAVKFYGVKCRGVIPVKPDPETLKNMQNVYNKSVSEMLAEMVVAKRNASKTTLPTDASARKDVPIVRGVLDYFPAAIAEVARVSKKGNDQHNPGEEMHHARGKSSDHADCLVRHLMERGTLDTDGLRHTAKVAWRALALLQLELEAAGAPLARGAKK